MKISRNNHDIIVSFRIHVYDRFWPRFKGLMFRKKPIDGEGFLFIPCNSIHMFFMFFPIDVVFLNGNDFVVAVRGNVKPNWIIFPVGNAVKALELPAGTIEKYTIDVGDQVIWEN